MPCWLFLSPEDNSPYSLRKVSGSELQSNRQRWHVLDTPTCSTDNYIYEVFATNSDDISNAVNKFSPVTRFPGHSIALFCPAGSPIVEIASSGSYTSGSTNITRSKQIKCEIGFACVGGVRASCNRPGQYADEVGLSACRIASAGVKPSLDRTSTVPCPIGEASLGGQDTCSPCDAIDEYADEIGLSACKKATECGPGWYISVESTASEDTICSKVRTCS